MSPEGKSTARRGTYSNTLEHLSRYGFDSHSSLHLNRRVAIEVMELAERVGWLVRSKKTASTGSVYIELVRDGREWLVVRVANHKQVYHHWITTISIAPGDLWFEELEFILAKPFGTVGDVLL